MKFLDEWINKAVQEKVSSVLKELADLKMENKSIRIELSEVALLKQRLDKLEDYLSGLDYIESEIEAIKFRLTQHKEDLEIGLNGIIKVFSEKFEDSAYKKPIITDLLKKIAKLEGQNVQP